MENKILGLTILALAIVLFVAYLVVVVFELVKI